MDDYKDMFKELECEKLDNKCILSQLGYTEEDKEMAINKGDYLDIRLLDNLFVGVNSNCSSIVIHTFNRTLLDIDILESRLGVNITIPVLIDGGYDASRNHVCSSYDLILHLKRNGSCDEYWRAQKTMEEELLVHTEYFDYKPKHVLKTILDTIKSNEKYIEGVDIDQIIELLGRALGPMLERYREEQHGSFLFSWILSCQQHDDSEIVLIDNKGLRVAKVPEVHEPDLDWSSSGLYNPNAWRYK